MALLIFASRKNKKKMGNGSKLIAITLFAATTIEGKKNVTTSPIFASSKNKEKMGNGNKLVVVALFTTTTTKEKKMR